jgi:hypothetical protein
VLGVAVDTGGGVKVGQGLALQNLWTPTVPSATLDTKEGALLLRVINYTCYACTLISVPLAIFLYLQSVAERAPTYYVSPHRARIVDTSLSAPLQVQYKGKDLNSDVTAATVYVWNNGKLPIKAEDVLEPITVQLEEGCQILDSRLLKVSRPVTKLAIADPVKNTLPVSFNILERGDGAAIQIIYAGKPDTTIVVRGTVVGAEPHILAPDEKTFEAIARKRTLTMERTGAGALTVLCSFLAGIALAFFLEWFRDPRAKELRMPTKYKLGMGALGTAALLLTVGGILLAHSADTRLKPAVPGSIWMQE